MHTSSDEAVPTVITDFCWTRIGQQALSRLMGCNIEQDEDEETGPAVMELYLIGLQTTSIGLVD